MTVSITPPETPNYSKLIALGTLAQIQAWVGKGEVYANNRGPFVSMITQGRVGAWCAALWVGAMEKVCKEHDWHPPVKRTHSARRLLARIIASGREVSYMDCQPGDCVCFARGIPGVQGHFAVVESVVTRGVYILLDGNVGSFRRTQGAVRRYQRDLIERHAAGKLVGCGRLY